MRANRDASPPLPPGRTVARFDGAHGCDVRHFFHNPAARLILSVSRDRAGGSRVAGSTALSIRGGQSDRGSLHKDIRVWRTAEDTAAPEQMIFPVHTLKGHTFVVSNVCTNADGSRAAGKELHHNRTARNLHTVVQGGENLKLFIWDLRGDR
eukprot:gene28858-52018_t